jgi:hypothetical protein
MFCAANVIAFIPEEQTYPSTPSQQFSPQTKSVWQEEENN